MRGHIVKVTTGGRSLEEYLKGCNQAGQGLEAYLGEHSDGLRFHRYADGTKCSSKRLRDGGLEMLLDGRDPDSGLPGGAPAGQGGAVEVVSCWERARL